MDKLLLDSQKIIEKGSKSFAMATRLFDAKTYKHAVMLYAWCRHCDDQIDGQVLGHGQASPPAEEQARRLDELRQQTHNAIAGKTVEGLPFQAFQRVFHSCKIPQRYPMELLDGFQMDIARRTYKTLDDTLSYCYHVAGTVGAMMACTMGIRDEGILNRAVDLGIAFQLTNICRDVLQDAADDRVYLPQTWLADKGAPEAPAAFAQHTDALSLVCSRVLDEAKKYYESSEYGIARLPFRCAWAIATARAVYQDIGRLVRARGDQAWAARVATSSGRKTWLLCTSLIQTLSAVTIKRYRRPPERHQLWSAPDLYVLPRKIEA